jgi:bacterioferritin (cytochrome b1)
MKEKEVHELLYQVLETELGGVLVYEMALRCAKNSSLREEWEGYHEQTKQHVRIAEDLLRAFGLDPSSETPGRKVVRSIGQSLVKAMEMALAEAGPASAQLVAAECVTVAETKDHLNWELVSEVASHQKGDRGKLLQEARNQVEREEDEHLYHTMGWSRELWIEALGLSAVLPPPEERKNVTSAIGAARAKQARAEMRA